jgi:hypothetical protein
MGKRPVGSGDHFMAYPPFLPLLQEAVTRVQAADMPPCHVESVLCQFFPGYLVSGGLNHMAGLST